MALGFRPALLLGMLVGVLALVAGKEKKAASTEGATSSGASSTAAHVHNGPYAPIAGMISDTKKKSSFYNLLKKMREVKNSDAKGTEAEAKKNATRKALNGDMQKLLGDEVYQKYRAVRVANTAKAKASGGHTGTGGHSGTVHTGASPSSSPSASKSKKSSAAAAPASGSAPAASSSSSASKKTKSKVKKPAAPSAP